MHCIQIYENDCDFTRWQKIYKSCNKDLSQISRQRLTATGVWRLLPINLSIVSPWFTHNWSITWPKYTGDLLHYDEDGSRMPLTHTYLGGVMCHYLQSVMYGYDRTPESSLRGISIIRINFSKICLRFMIIRIKITDFGKNLTLLIWKDPADFWRLVWQSG